MLIEQQIAERRDRAGQAVVRVLNRPAAGPYGDYKIKSASGRTYRVAVRGPGLFENYCSCPDFAVNTLGTCKHIEAILSQLRRRNSKALEHAAYKRTRASISLHYGDRLEVRLRLPVSPSHALNSLAENYFDPEGRLLFEHYAQFAHVLDALRKADEQAVIYSDVLEYIDRENELGEGLDLERKLLRRLTRGQDPLAGVLKTKLLPYQAQGAIFAACRGRVALADDMGLGKTVQALAAAELLRRRKGIERVLVIAPASVKYQWKTEIEKFTDLPAQIIDGLLPRRRALYASPAFFNLTSYELVLKDVRYKLIGDDALAKEMTPPRSFDIFEDTQAWQQSHPYPKSDDPPEKKRAYAEAALEIAATWIAQAPDRIGGYSERLHALERLDAPVEQIARAADDVVRIARTDDRAGGAGFIANVAHLYVTRGILLDRVPALIEEALKMFDDPEAVIEIDLAPSHELTVQARMNNASSHVSSLVTLSEYYEKLGQMEQARGDHSLPNCRRTGPA